jgi:hypothetical protein
MNQKQKDCFCYRLRQRKFEASLRLALLIFKLARAILVVWFLISGLKS